MARPNPFSSLPAFRRGSFVLFAVTAVLSALLGDQPIAARLLLDAHGVLGGHDLWTPVSANFIYPVDTLVLLVQTGLVQWFIGSELEGFWGARKYLTLVVGCGICGHLAAVACALVVPVATPLGGTPAIDLAAVAAFGVVYGKRQLRALAVLPLRGRGLALLWIGLTVFGALIRGMAWTAIVPWVVAITGAVLITTQPWRGIGDSGKLSRRKKARRRHLRVVRPDSKLLN